MAFVLAKVPWLDEGVRAAPPLPLPVGLTREEVRAILARRGRAPRLMATWRYGSGLRRLDGCRLRGRDVDSGRNPIPVRRGKGDKDRVTMLPGAIKAHLAAHLQRAREQHRRDLAEGFRGADEADR